MNAFAASSQQGPELGPGELERIARLLQADAGIQLPTGKISLVQARLSRRLRAVKLSSYAEYCNHVESPDGRTEREEMLFALTTNVTKFFREPHHFDDLQKRILPPLIERARKGGAVRLWSAGCSSGEEPYSLAMTILKNAPDAANLDIRVLATDIDKRILAKARAGVYPGVSTDQLSQYAPSGAIEKTPDGGIKVSQTVRSMVTFNQLNLHSDWPMRRHLDVILCRNVVIYFAKSDENKIWSRMVQILNPGGVVMVGHSERIPLDRLPNMSLDGITTYRKADTQAA